MTRREWLALTAATAAAQTVPAQREHLRLWFRQPADRWIHALPVGNGRLGAMVYGGFPVETLNLNEDSLWSGEPHTPDATRFRESLPKVRELLFAGKYDEANEVAGKGLAGEQGAWFGSYQTLGDLRLRFDAGAPSDYERELDLEDGIARVKYTAEGVTYTREVFASAPQQAVIIRLEASAPGKLNFDLTVTRPEADVAYEIPRVVWSGQAKPGVAWAATCTVKTEGGGIGMEGSSLRISGANKATLIIKAATNYRGRKLDAAHQPVELSYADLKAAHLKEHRRLFARVALDLGGNERAKTPTDERLAAVQKGAQDPQLAVLYFQYGRYLLLSSSRPGGLPANLQGLWAGEMSPPWSADYHVNINIPMNYWPAEVTNLSECHEPLFDFTEGLLASARRTAHDYYGAGGATIHFTANPWGYTIPGSSIGWGLWQDGLTWLARHFWERWLFSRDRAFLADRAWPVMKEAANFYLDFMVQDPRRGKLVPGPQTSPENAYKTASGKRGEVAMGTTTSIQAIRDLFGNLIDASKTLNREPEFAARLQKAMERMPPAVEIGRWGQVKEWPEDFDENEPGHRHVSQLYGLHPAALITPDKTPEWAAAARKTLERRLANGGGQTGWSAAWMVNFFARLGDGNAAHAALCKLLRQSTEPNLFDTHPGGKAPIFQIDGNFGGCAGIAEMLVESHEDSIHLLPAVPDAWQEGSVRGLRARGGFELGISWRGGKLTQAEILARVDGPCRIRAANPIKAHGAKAVSKTELMWEAKSGTILKVTGS